MSTPDSAPTAVGRRQFADQRRRRQRRRRLFRTIAVAVSVLAVIAAVVVAIVLAAQGRDDTGGPTGETGDDNTAPATDDDTLSPAAQLLATTDDPAACAVTLEVEGATPDPVLETTDHTYDSLPILESEGRVFAGWYLTPEAASELTHTERMNGSRFVECTDQQQTLYGAWVTPEENEAEATPVPILMYHQFTDRPEGEDGWLSANYAYIGDWRDHMEYIRERGFYQPTWPELRAFIDGELFLPYYSIIVTDDDADETWQTMAQPIAIENGVMVTSFAITIDGVPERPSELILLRSHTHDMHRAGANGEGLMTNLSAEEIAADLQTSAELLGQAEVIAYPFGHYNETTKEGVRLAGFDMGRTIEQGYVRIGTDPYALPVIRINYGMTVDDIIPLIG